MLKVNLKNISIKSTYGSRELLSKIHFTLPPNRILSIIGSNGAGKSTLLKSLTGLLDKSLFEINGNVIYNDTDLLNSETEYLRDVRATKIKYIFQDAVTSFDPLKKLEYYFRRFLPHKKNYINELLEYFTLPSYEDVGKMYPFELSGGMAQRLSLILATVPEPEILLLDEPTSGIDAPMVNMVIHFLRKFATEKNNSVLLVTHDLLYAKSISNNIAVLNDGKLSEFQKRDEQFNYTQLTQNQIDG